MDKINCLDAYLNRFRKKSWAFFFVHLFLQVTGVDGAIESLKGMLWLILSSELISSLSWLMVWEFIGLNAANSFSNREDRDEETRYELGEGDCEDDCDEDDDAELVKLNIILWGNCGVKSNKWVESVTTLAFNSSLSFRSWIKWHLGPYGQKPFEWNVLQKSVLYLGWRVTSLSSFSPCANWHLSPYLHSPFSLYCLHISVLYRP